MDSLLLDGLKLMVIGMLTVFVFLVVMIICMNIMAKLLAPLAGFLEPKPAAPKAQSGDDDAATAAAAAVAVHLFRNK